MITSEFRSSASTAVRTHILILNSHLEHHGTSSVYRSESISWKETHLAEYLSHKVGRQSLVVYLASLMVLSIRG